MWIVVLTGVFSVLTLLAKAAIDTGSKATRKRRAIAADLDLLAKLRETAPNASGLPDLEERIDRQLIEFALSDLAPAPASAADDHPEPHRARDAVRRLSGLIAVSASLVSGIAAAGLWRWLSDVSGRLGGEGWMVVASAGAALLGVVVTLTTANSLRRAELTQEEYERLLIASGRMTGRKRP